jgi:hypothetical protein
MDKLIKQLKLALFSVAVFAAIGSMVFISSCRNPCRDIVCRNNGTCREGACACPSGFEGRYCENRVSEKFAGYWEGFTRCNGEPNANITFIVTQGPTPRDIEIYNLFTPGISIKAVITGNKIDIPTQTITVPAGNYTYRGNGYVEIIGKDIYFRLFYEETDPVPVFRSCYFEAKRIYQP